MKNEKLDREQLLDNLQDVLNDSMTDIDNDYQYGDEWDWDRNDRSQYCEHGTFIGSWWGPDLLCGKCEMGDEPMNIDDTDDF